MPANRTPVSTAAVVAALQKLIGAKGNIATVSYTVSPRYSNGTATQGPYDHRLLGDDYGAVDST